MKHISHYDFSFQNGDHHSAPGNDWSWDMDPMWNELKEDIYVHILKKDMNRHNFEEMMTFVVKQGRGHLSAKFVLLKVQEYINLLYELGHFEFSIDVSSIIRGDFI